MLLIKKHEGGSDFDTHLSFNVLVARGFTKKPGYADSYFLQSAGTQTSNFPFPGVYHDNQTVAFLLEVSYCVLREQDSWGMIYQFRQAPEQAEVNCWDRESSKPVMSA